MLLSRRDLIKRATGLAIVAALPIDLAKVEAAMEPERKYWQLDKTMIQPRGSWNDLWSLNVEHSREHLWDLENEHASVGVYAPRIVVEAENLDRTAKIRIRGEQVTYTVTQPGEMEVLVKGRANTLSLRVPGADLTREHFPDRVFEQSEFRFRVRLDNNPELNSGQIYMPR